jgi:2-polyprenyl-6-methoxyphenol hydroxylase-like FAD-dependent oxidoreductase
MQNKIIHLIIVIFLSLSLFAKESEPRPLSVLIIGGGPAGLATAIEAKTSGFAVTVIEKREAYTRSQTLFLLDSSLKFLDKWEIDIPQMHLMDLGEGTRIGIVQIKYLEEQLGKKARQLGVNKITGQFRGFSTKKTALILSSGKKELAIPYDVIVAADGTHSSVRDSLGIKANCLGTASGAFTFVSDPMDVSKQVEITPAIKIENGFLRRIKVPCLSIVFIQTHSDASKNCLEKALREQGWTIEALAVAENKTPVVTHVPIFLQQTVAFSDEKASAVLVGDAAATASFFKGMGANTALKTAEIAGRFFKETRAHKETAYLNFNEAMKEATDALIEDSAFLFIPKQPEESGI